MADEQQAQQQAQDTATDAPLTYEDARRFLEAEIRRMDALLALRQVVKDMQAWLNDDAQEGGA